MTTQPSNSTAQPSAPSGASATAKPRTESPRRTKRTRVRAERKRANPGERKSEKSRARGPRSDPAGQTAPPAATAPTDESAPQTTDSVVQAARIRGHGAWQVTEIDRRTAVALARYGMTLQEIADWFGVEPVTLKRHMALELAVGKAMAVSAVLRQMFRDATDPNYHGRTGAQAVWLKFHAGRTEKQRIELEIDDMRKLAVEEASKLGIDGAEAVEIVERLLAEERTA